MIWEIITGLGIGIVLLFGICGSCYEWGWQRGYRTGIDRGKQIDRLVDRTDSLRGWNPPSHCCHGISIDVQCPACAALTAGL